MKTELICPHCGQAMEKYRNPFLTVDIIIETDGGIVLIKRKNPPYGWALPGGFVDCWGSIPTPAAIPGNIRFPRFLLPGPTEHPERPMTPWRSRFSTKQPSRNPWPLIIIEF